MHNKRQYTKVEKLVHLKGHVDGEAARYIQGLATTTDNYDIAVNILRERYDREDLRRETLMDKLINFPKVTEGESLKSLHSLVDELTANVRALGELKIPTDNYGQLLLPVLKSRVPESWRLQ